MVSINLFVTDTPKALKFYESVFNATAYASLLNEAPGNRSTRFKVGNQPFALADENPKWGSKSPLTLGGVPLCLNLDVENISETLGRMLTYGGHIVAPSTDKEPIFTLPHGGLLANVVDPFGFIWSLTQEKKPSFE